MSGCQLPRPMIEALKPKERAALLHAFFARMKQWDIQLSQRRPKNTDNFTAMRKYPAPVTANQTTLRLTKRKLSKSNQRILLGIQLLQKTDSAMRVSSSKNVSLGMCSKNVAFDGKG